MRRTKLFGKFFFHALFISLAFNSLSQKTLSTLSKDGQLKMAFDLLERGNVQAAYHEFETFYNNNNSEVPLSKEVARYYAGHCALLLRHPNAEQMLLAFEQQYPHSVMVPKVWYDLGNQAYSIKKWETSVQYYTRIPDGSLSQSQQTEVSFKSGVACFQLQQYDRSRAYFQKVKSGDRQWKAQAAYYTAYLSYKDGQLDDALADLDIAAGSPEYKPNIPVLKASILYKKKAYQEVIELTKATEKDTAKYANPEELQLLAGEAYFNLKDYKAAADCFDKYTKLVKKNPERPLHFRISFAYFKTDQTDKAIGGFRQVAARMDTLKGKKDTLGQMASYYLGVCYLKKDQKQFALSAFDQASLLQADSKIQEVAWFNAGKLSYDLEKYSDAVEILKDFCENFPKSEYVTEANELIGEGLLNSNDFDAALAYMEKSKIKSERINLAYQRAAYQQGVTQFNDGNFSKASELFAQSLKFSNDKETKIAALFWQGETASKERQFAKALSSYQEVIKLDNSAANIYLAKAHFGAGYAHFNLKEYAKAIPHFSEFIRETEKTTSRTYLSDGILRLGDCYYATKEYPQSLRTYDKAIDYRTPELDYAFYQKGMVYSALKDYENARTNFSIVVEKYPRSKYYDGALFQKAQMDFEATNYQAAIRGFSKIIDQMPESPVLPFCYLNRGISASNLKEYGEAVKDFKKILEDYPGHSTANSAILGLQEALVQTGEIDQLNAYIGKFKKANPGSDALESIEFETCKALYNNQKYAKAIEGFRDFIKNYSGSTFIPEARFYLAESHFRGGSKAEALALYKDILSQGKSTWYIRSSFRVADLEYGNGNFEAAAAQYRNLLNGGAKSIKDVNNATLGLAETCYQLGKYDTVAVLTAELLKKENLAQDVSNKASLYAAKVYVGKGEYEKAIDELLNTVNNAQDVNGAEAQYLVAEVFFKQKKYNESLGALFDLKSRFSAYPKWYNKGFLLMADNYIAQKEYFQAQATLNSIIENAKDKETTSAAKSKLQALKAELGGDAKP